MSDQNPDRLEQLLRLAATEPGHRPAFVRTLLDSTVHVIGSTDEGHGERVLPAGSSVALQHWHKQDGTLFIPFFTSLELLQASNDTPGASWLALPARSLFEITLGASLILNPQSSHGKEFLPEEVRHLLDTGLGHEARPRTVQKATQILLGQPARYPSKMVASLRVLLAKHAHVERAFLAWMHDPSASERAHLIVGIEADGDVAQVMQEAGSVAADAAADQGPVDLYRIAGSEDTVSRYFTEQTKPFYVRARASTGWSLFRRWRS